MSTFGDIKQELKNKERSITDLIRFLKTRTDLNPNYSLLMGAGCSVTSGIKSANDLIRQWKKDIYQQEKNIYESDFIEDDIETFYSNQMWYDSRNPYSSLFEKKYDLPRQRRMFVEQEVSDKIPSIGYSYLIKLVENNYLKTLFTTNFDDLLNEAFYQYSNERPILCAHDSAISSITITSKRPKIIKLHGDYLFDDIKSTLRETESLEENIKNKFIEFAKDYGLIVVGYGGNDRSVVDILTYLLKNEEYFKHGIYWCLREDSFINEDLRKLLWKDRVYYVKIDGFDELMAEIHSKLNESILPIDNSYLNERKNELIEQLITNPMLINTTCKFIQDDFARLSKAKEQNIVKNFFKYINSKDSKDEYGEGNQDGFVKTINGNRKLSEDDQKYLLEINQEIITSNYKYACTLINNKINKIDKNCITYIKLLELNSKCLINLNDKNGAVKCFKELIEIDGENIRNYIELSNLSEGYIEKLNYIEKAIKLDPYYSFLYYRKAALMFEQFDKCIDKDLLEFKLEDIIAIADKCIEVNPKINNSIWNLKFDLIKEKHKETKTVIDEFSNLIEKLEKQDKYFPKTVQRKVEFFKLKEVTKNAIYDYIKECISNSNAKEYLKHNEFILLDYLAENNDRMELKERMAFIEKNYITDDDYLEKKAQILLKKFDDLDSAISIIKSIKSKEVSAFHKLFDFLLFKEEFQEAEEILEKHLNNEKSLYESLYTARKEYKKSLDYVRELRKDDENDHSLCLAESYLLLKTGQFQEAYIFLSKYLKPSNFTDPYLLINYYIASKKHKGNIHDEKIKEKILTGKKQKDIIEAAAYALINDQKNAYSKMASAINTDYTNKYIIKDWIVFEELFKIEKFKKLIE